MATLHRARVCAIGSEEDMIRLCTQLLANVDALPEEDERPAYKLDELRGEIIAYTHQYAGELETFMYSMISGMRFGDAEQGSCRLNIRREPCGLWTACFAYDSASAFQTHEWLDLHKKCGNILMVAQRASWDFGLDKGEIIFTGGGMLDNWDSMLECWLWLIPQYECGYPPEEAVRRLHKLQGTMEREDSDLTVDELLKSCMDNLNAIAMSVEDSEQVAQRLAHCRETRDFMGLLEVQHMVAESVLWETDHNAKWLACLESVREAWLAGE